MVRHGSEGDLDQAAYPPAQAIARKKGVDPSASETVVPEDPGVLDSIQVGRKDDVVVGPYGEEKTIDGSEGKVVLGQLDVDTQAFGRENLLDKLSTSGDWWPEPALQDRTTYLVELCAVFVGVEGTGATPES